MGGGGGVRGGEEVPVTEPGGPEGRNERDEPHEDEAGDQATAEEEEEQDSGEWAAEEEWRRREQCRECTYEEDEEAPATEAGGLEGSNECVSADRDEELSDVQVSDEEEHYERIERRFGYNPDKATSGRSIRRLWEMTGLHGSTI
jgi:hypothetical protein